MLEIKDLHVEVDGRKILKGINMIVEDGKVNILMGPNGGGKSTLANVIVGNPKYKITKGDILVNGKSILDKKVDERAKLGLFMSFQHPQEIDGVGISSFLRQAYNYLHKDKKLSLLEFQKLLEEKAKILGLDKDFYNRYLNKGFSGGEKKKSEVLQLLVLNPKIAILDETDSGTDIDSLKIIADGINKFKGKDRTILVITHYKRFPDLISPDKVFIMVNGQIVEQGDKKLIEDLEEKGYKCLLEK